MTNRVKPFGEALYRLVSRTGAGPAVSNGRPASLPSSMATPFRTGGALRVVGIDQFATLETVGGLPSTGDISLK
jgi:hypothetical protein